MPNALDRSDKALLVALQGNARLTVAQLAESVALTTSPCWRRVKMLEDSGVITGYQAILSPKALGYGVTAFVSIMMASHSQEVARSFEQRLLDIPEIVACHNISGRYDFLLEVVARDLESFGEFAREVLDEHGSRRARRVLQDGGLVQDYAVERGRVEVRHQFVVRDPDARPGDFRAVPDVGCFHVNAASFTNRLLANGERRDDEHRSADTSRPFDLHNRLA